jgi:hypothetical protein
MFDDYPEPYENDLSVDEDLWKQDFEDSRDDFEEDRFLDSYMEDMMSGGAEF